MLEFVRLVLLLLIALVPPVILAARLRNAELHRREPWRVLWRAFAWGATVAAAIAILLESAMRPVLADASLVLPALTIGIVVVAPLIEELAKALGLRFIDDHDPEPEDGFIYGGAVGLGFAATENTIYVLSAHYSGGQEIAMATAVYRIATVALHGAASAIAGYGVWRARYGGTSARRAAGARARLSGGRWWAVWGILGAVGLHAAYNALAGVGLGLSTLLAATVAIFAYVRMMRRVTALDARDLTRPS